MNKSIRYITAAMAMLAMAACSHDHADDHADADDDHHHGPGEIVLEPEVASALGVVVEPLELKPISSTLTLTGIVEGDGARLGQAAAPTAGRLKLAAGITVGSKVAAGQTIATINQQAVAGGNQTAVAKATLEAAERELARLEPLYREGIVTAAQYNQAQQAVAEAKAAFSPQAANGTVAAPIAGIVTALDATDGAVVAEGATIATIQGQSGPLTLKYEFPTQQAATVAPQSTGQVAIPGTDIAYPFSELGIAGVGTPGNVNGAYTTYYATITHPQALRPGMVVDVYIQQPTAAEGYVLPRQALTESQGSYYIYVRQGEHTYVKRAVAIASRDANTVVVTGPLNPGDNIVVQGAAAVKLAETTGKAPEGHSHNH